MNPEPALDVLVLPHSVAALRTPWADDVLAAVSARHRLRLFDPAASRAAQVGGIAAVVDVGLAGLRDLLDDFAAAGVRLIQAQTNGLDHLPLDAVRERGLALAHCPGYLSAPALAQSAMMFILMLAGRYRQAQANFREGPYYLPAGDELEGKVLGIVGFGASGTELARRARPFGLRIHAIDVRPIDRALLDELQPEFLGGAQDLDRVVAESDFLSVHLHLTADTRHIIDQRRLGLMKPTACLINVARGALVDEAALHRALLAGRLGGAGLDAFSREPPDPTLPAFQLPNVVVTPHNAGGTTGTSRRRAAFAAANLDRLARGEAPLGLVCGAERFA